MYYTIGYIDFEKNSLISSDNLYIDLSIAAYDLNFTISDLILKKYDILLRNSFLFVCKDELKDSINNVKINKDINIVTEKKGMEIDIFFINEKKGYIYNSMNRNHIYKFFINKHSYNTTFQNNPIENLDGKTDLVDNNSSVCTSSYQINDNCLEWILPPKELYVKFRSSTDNQKLNNCDTVSENIIFNDNIEKELNFKQDDIVVLENWLGKNETFVKELSDKIKKYKVE